MGALFSKSGNSEKNKRDGKSLRSSQDIVKEREMAGSLNLVNTRLTLLEDRYNTVREQINFGEKTLIDNRNNINQKIKVLDSEMNDLNNEMKDLREKVQSLQEEIGRSAKEEELRVIDKYLDLWEPLEFVTREEVKKAFVKLKKGAEE